MLKKNENASCSPMLWIKALNEGTLPIDENNWESHSSDWVVEATFFGESLKLDEIISFEIVGKVSNTNHLHIVRLTIRKPKALFRKADSSKSGYYFKGGLKEEIIYILSVFFQTRFHLICEETENRKTQYQLPSINLNSRYWEFLSKKSPGYYFRSLENSKEYFECIKRLSSSQQQQFILSCQNFHSALKGLDESEKHEDVVISLIKSIEPLCKDYLIEDMADITSRIIAKLKTTHDFDDEEKALIQKLINSMKAQKKFIAFIKHYSTDFFKSVPKNRQKVQISENQIDSVLKQLYDSRSKYVHEGEPMHFSQTYNKMHEWEWEWDKDSSVGSVVHQRRLGCPLPYLHWQIRLVRHCLLSYIDFPINNN